MLISGLRRPGRVTSSSRMPFLQFATTSKCTRQTFSLLSRRYDSSKRTLFVTSKAENHYETLGVPPEASRAQIKVITLDPFTTPLPLLRMINSPTFTEFVSNSTWTIRGCLQCTTRSLARSITQMSRKALVQRRYSELHQRHIQC